LTTVLQNDTGRCRDAARAPRMASLSDRAVTVPSADPKECRGPVERFRRVVGRPERRLSFVSKQMAYDPP